MFVIVYVDGIYIFFKYIHVAVIFFNQFNIFSFVFLIFNLIILRIVYRLLKLRSNKEQILKL